MTKTTAQTIAALILGTEPSLPRGRRTVDETMSDGDRDSLHTLPLALLPLNLTSLSQAKMIKDIQMKSMVQLYNSSSSGSGLMEVAALRTVFDETEKFKADLVILEQMEKLHSYDVYSLRIELRRLGISIEDQTDLQLSEDKAKELTVHLTEFTRPLIRQIYGSAGTGTGAKFEDVDQLLAMFRGPDRADAVKRLKIIADKLGVRLVDLPGFLEEYGDVFLSLAYYKDALNEIIPKVRSFIDEMDELNKIDHIRQMPRFKETCGMLNGRFDGITTSLLQRFENFDNNSKNLWNSIDGATFQSMKDTIEAQYANIGGVLSGLGLKMNAWEGKFPGGRGGPIPKANFILSDMRLGLNHIYEIEKSAPAVSLLH